MVTPGLEHWYPCVSGSGIGLLHSSAVSNWVFYRLVEVRFIHDLAGWGIVAYIRYHDDVFITFVDRPAMKKFMNYYRSIMGFYTFLARCVSSSCVDILDLDTLAQDWLEGVE